MIDAQRLYTSSSALPRWNILAVFRENDAAMKRDVLILMLLLGGCAANQAYVHPTAPSAVPSNSAIVEKPRGSLWKEVVPTLDTKRFAVTNADKQSGLLTIGYTGDPVRYIDCGRVNARVKSGDGERSDSFPGAAASQNYELTLPQGLFRIERHMALDARTTLVFEEITSDRTRLTATTRYVVTRTIRVTDANNRSSNFTDTISFDSGSGASFPAHKDGKATECVATGLLESELLSLLN